MLEIINKSGCECALEEQIWNLWKVLNYSIVNFVNDDFGESEVPITIGIQSNTG